MSRQHMSKGKSGMLSYKYRAGGCVDFCFNTLAEVGEPYQQWFRDALKRKCWEVETRELDRPPWVADFAIDRRPGYFCIAEGGRGMMLGRYATDEDALAAKKESKIPLALILNEDSARYLAKKLNKWLNLPSRHVSGTATKPEGE